MNWTAWFFWFVVLSLAWVSIDLESRSVVEHQDEPFYEMPCLEGWCDQEGDGDIDEILLYEGDTTLEWDDVTLGYDGSSGQVLKYKEGEMRWVDVD